MANKKKMASRMRCSVVVLGDSRAGKSALIRRFVEGKFSEQYSPTSFDKSYAAHEVDKHDVEFTFWDTSGSPAYDSVRSLAFHDADVFLLCFNVSDPISLYNVKNKWIGEIRKHRPSPAAPVVLCGCQADLRADPVTASHLAKTGRAPVSAEQALAICCEVEAVNYVETSAVKEDNSEALQLCALATMKHVNNNNNNNNNNTNNFRRSPSIQSSLSLFDGGIGGGHLPPKYLNSGNFFKRSPSTNSNLSLAANFKMPSGGGLSNVIFKRSSVTSLRSPAAETPPEVPSEQEVRSLRTFSPEPVSSRIPPVISENEAFQTPDQMRSFSPMSEIGNCPATTSNIVGLQRQRPSSLCEPLDGRGIGIGPPLLEGGFCLSAAAERPTRPTSLFKGTAAGRQLRLVRQQFPVVAATRGATVLSPTASYTSDGGVSHQPGNLATSPPHYPFGGGHPLHQPFFSPFAVDSPQTDLSLSSSSAVGTPMSSASSAGFVIRSPQMDIVSPTNAQVFSNGLSRRTTYRTHPKMAIPVAAPMSPVPPGEDPKSVRSGCQSPTESVIAGALPGKRNDDFREAPNHHHHHCLPSSSSTYLANAQSKPQPKIYESLKSQFSSCSVSSSGDDSSLSKLPSDFGSEFGSEAVGTVVTSTASRRFPENATMISGKHVAASEVAESPQLLSDLNFVSPKSGVYRPRPRQKHGCSVM